jgi:pimeloyl-ACP methyl ester carboxylesterase
VHELDVSLPDGRTLHAYDRGDPSGDRVAVIWHHGTPNIGPPPEPLFEAADRLGLRWIGYDRPGYGGSTPHPGRTIADAATNAAAVADRLGIDRFAVMGHSGGGPHALACAALLPDRVRAAVSMSGLAPFTASGLDWFAGMIPDGEASLRAAAGGRAAKEQYELSGAEYDPQFTASDLATLEGEWRWIGSVVGPALAAGPGGLIDDDVAYVEPWGFDPASIAAPVLLVHGESDGIVPVSHGRWLSEHISDAQWWPRPEAGHVSVLESAGAALDWLAAHAS